MRRRFKPRHPLLIATALLLALGGYLYWNNHAIQIHIIQIPAHGLPAQLDGLRIAQISDLHNTSFGEDNKHLLSKLSQTKPDLIVITGDLIDSRRTDLPVALTFAAGAVDIAPTYYVTGNHESRVPEYLPLRQGLLDLGVTVLEDTRVLFEQENAKLSILGINDPTFGTFSTALPALTQNTKGYTVLLSHRPEKFEAYVQSGVDLVFTGHAHGGQIRIPFLGGLIAPHQGYFPTYDSGLYSKNNTHMIVSRGLGNSLFPFRVNNPPEIVVAVLNAEK